MSNYEKDPLGQRMKSYEAATRLVLPRRTYTIVRVDGRAFHTFLRHASKPWDEDVVRTMQKTAQRLCEALDGAVLGYTQSDEISIVLQDFENNGTQAWFGGVVQKQASIAAATATAYFTAEYRHHFDLDDGPLPVFDARVFTIPDIVEVANYLIWRQRDAVRNSILGLGQAHFSHRQLQGINTSVLRDMLDTERGIVWERDVSEGLRQGWIVRKKNYDATPADAEPLTLRTCWEADPAPEFKADGTGMLAQLLPAPRQLA